MQILCMEGSIIKLFDKLHFYEIMIKENGSINESELFNYLIRGDGTCSKETSEFLDQDFYSPYLNLQADTQIYSNYEQTMSFLIEIQFEVLPEFRSINYSPIGFELIFESPSKAVSCVQILASKDSMNLHDKKYTFTVKDPVFIGQMTNYIFYFGKVSIKALVRCGDNSFCSLKRTKTSSNVIGIYTDKDIDDKPLKYDLCLGHVLRETCIKRYENQNHYTFIIHPLPAIYDSMYSDLNILQLDHDSKEYVRDAKKKGKKFIKIGHHTYPTNLLSEEDGLIDSVLVHNIESHQHQKLNRDIIIKMVQPKNSHILYLGLLKEPNENNTCPIKSLGRVGCPCKGECIDCYSEQQMTDPSKPLNYIPLKPINDGTGLEMSRGCINKFFAPYEFDKVKIRSMFQQQSLANFRKNKYSLDDRRLPKNNVFFNRNILPGVCIIIQKSEIENKFDIKLKFVDQHHTAKALIFPLNKYLVKVYTYTHINASINPAQKLELTPIKLTFVHQKLIEVTNSLEMKSIEFNNYFIVVTPMLNNSFCAKPTDCIDEGLLNNQVKCVPCNKLIISLPILNQKRILTSRSGKCTGSDNYDVFEDILWYLLQGKVSLNSSKIVNKFRESKLISGIIPEYFNLESILLPYHAMINENEPAFRPNNAQDFWDTSTLSILIFILGSLMISIAMDFYLKYKAKEFILKTNYKKRILFYISISVDDIAQKKILSILKEYEALKEILPEVKFNIITFSTNSVLRESLLENADLICYVCITSKDINNLDNIIEFGKNSFQHDYNRIQIGRYRFKSINLTFNKRIEKCLYLTEENYLYERKSLFELESQKTSSSFVGKNSNQTSTKNSTNASSYYKLPSQNSRFIHLLFSGTECFMISNKSRYTSLKLRPFYPFYTCCIDFYKKLLKKINSSKFRQNTYELYSEYIIEKKSKQIASRLDKILCQKNMQFSEDIEPSKIIDDEMIFADELGDDYSLSFVNQDPKLCSEDSKLLIKYN